MKLMGHDKGGRIITCLVRLHSMSKVGLAIRFPGKHYGKVSVREMCFCEDSRAKPNRMSCAHFPEKKNVPIIT